MPGNEATDKLFNFFGQENLPQGQHNSQLGSADWPVVGNNPWVGNQRQIGAALNSDTENYNIQQSDSEIVNNQQAPQTLFHANNTQLTPRQEFIKRQFRNQELSLNGLIHEHQTLQNRQNHTEFDRLKSVSDQHKLTSSGLSVIEQQRGNAPEHSPSLARTSERLEIAEAPIKFDSLSRQQALMSNQQPGMSQPRPRQQPGLNDIQLWQQQYMFKQLQELQRQRQFPQLEPDGRHQNQMNQLSAFAKQAANEQLPAIVNGMPIHGSTNYPWQNELSGGDSKVPNSSQMFLVGNTNWAQRGGYPAVQGIPDGFLSTEQGQMLRSMGLVPQQLDPSGYGAHIANARGAFNQYSHLQGVPQDCPDMLNKGSGNHVEKPVMQSFTLTNSLQGGQPALFSNQVSMHDGASVSAQGFQGKNPFGHIPFQSMSTGVQPGNCMQANSVSGNTRGHEFQGREQQGGWSGNLQERTTSQVGSSRGMVSLDPTEKKILFSSDDNIWDTPGAKGGATGPGGYGDPLERQDNLNVFPSIQSGTWSALMQSAVAEASSSDTGIQDEWSGLSTHKREMSTVDQPLTLGDGTKQQTDWANSNLQKSSLISRPFPSFDDGKISQSGRNALDFQDSGTRNLYEQSERMQHDASFDNIQQSLDHSGKWLDHNPQQKTLVEGNRQVQSSMNSENAFQGAWNRQVRSENAAHATNVPLDAHSMHGSWAHQQATSSHSMGNQHPNNTSGWNNNINSLQASGDVPLKIGESENQGQRFQRNDLKMGMPVQRDHNGGLVMTNSFPNFTDGRSSHQVKGEAFFATNCTTIPNPSTTKAIETNQQVQSSQHLNYQKHMVDSPVNQRDDGMVYNQNLLGSQVVEASMYNSDRGSGEAYDKKRENCYQKEISNDSYNSNQSQPTVTGGGLRENSWLSTSDSHPMANASQSTGQVGRKAPVRRFQYHPMGSMEVDLEATDASKRVTPMQVPSQQTFQELKGHEREYFGHQEFNNHISNNAIAKETEHVPDFQGTEKGSASSDGSAGTFPQSKRTVQTCQNMLELFHNVDQPMEHGTPPRFSSSEQDTSAMPEAEGSDAAVTRQWHNQSTASQGFGLRLAPPSQRMSVTNHALNSQNSIQVANSLNSRQPDSIVEEKSQSHLAPTVSAQSLPREIPQRERWDSNPKISAQTGNETSRLNMQANFPAAFTPPFPYSRNQLQSQQMSRVGEKAMHNQAAHAANDRFASHFRQTQGSDGEAVADQSAHVSLPSTSGRNSFVASPSEDASQPETSSWSQVRVSGQQFPVLDSVPVSRPSPMSGRSQQGDFSTMLHHVWANVSAQQRPTGVPPNKLPPNFPQSVSPSNSNLERTSFTAHQPEQCNVKKVGNGLELSKSSTNSQRFAYGEDQTGKETSWKQIPVDKVDPAPQRTTASLGQESVMKHQLETKSTASVTHPHQQEVDRGRYGKDPVLVSQREHVALRNPATSTRDIEAFGRSLRQPNQNYSLLHQVQAMRSGENDLDKRGGKRFKEADGDADVQQLANRAGLKLPDGSSAICRDSLDGGRNVAVQHPSFSSADSKMLSFSSEGREDQNTNTPSKMVHGVVPSQDKVTFGRNDSPSHPVQLNVSSVRPENAHINPKMAPTWFDRYGTFRPENILPMQDTQNTLRPIPQQFAFGKGSEGFHRSNLKEQISSVDVSQIGNVSLSTVPAVVQSEDFTNVQPLPSEITDHTLSVVRPKKRKIEPSVPLPWHKEITCGSRRLQTISMAEQDWAQAANRLVEKMEDEAELADDGQLMIRQRRRLTFTTQLMQQILRPAPAKILSAKAASEFETVTYSVAKVALGEACSLISSSESDTHSLNVNENSKSGKLKTSEGRRDQHFSRVVEEFIGKAKKLETDLLRLDKRASIMDIKVECQDLEKFSVINRFAKFHGRSQADPTEVSSSSSAASAMSQKTCPQRYVTAHAMPRTLPGGVQCLSL